MPSLIRIFSQVLGRNGVDTVVKRVEAGQEPSQITVRDLMDDDQFNAYRRTVEAVRLNMIGKR